MKRLFIGVLALGMIGTAMAQDLRGSQSQSLLCNKRDKGIEMSTRAEEFGAGNWFGYCGEYYQGIGTGQPNTSLEAAIYIPGEIAQTWKGSQLTKINIGLGDSSNLDVLVYLTGDVTGEPFYTEEVTLERDGGWNQVTLSTPYTLDGTPFYVGYQIVTKSANDWPIGVDGIGTYLELGDLVGVNNYFEHTGTLFGSVCIQIELSGEAIPEFGAFVTDLNMPVYVSKDNEFEGYFTIINTGKNEISTVNLTAKVDGVEMEEPIVELFEAETLQFGSYSYMLVRGLYAHEPGANIPVEITINEIAGPQGVFAVDLGPLETNVICANELFDRNVVVEEFTGTWCGWCPRGMVGMEYMKENYGDKGFIGIAVHTGSDPMTVKAYQDFVNKFSDGAPSAVMDRTVLFDPNITTLETYYKIEMETPSPVKVDLKAVFDEDNQIVNATATSEFAFDFPGAPYRLVFVIIEDNVGPYSQTNYYSGGASGKMDGWEDLPKTVSTLYNDVARYIDTDYGIPGSLPTNILAGTPYEYSIGLPTNTCKNVNNCSVIAMVVDTQTYAVMNATKVSLEGQAGVEKLVAEPADGIYTVYNLQGVKVLETGNVKDIDALPSGIYIINGKKILL